LKSELGARPSRHRAEKLIRARAPVSVLARQLVNWARGRLKAAGARESRAAISGNLMGANRAAALSEEAGEADGRGQMPPEVVEARKRFKAPGTGRPAKASPERRRPAASPP
jgi:hypothetical protein